MHNNIAIEILDCFKYHQLKGFNSVSPRKFSALSFRINTECTYNTNQKITYSPKNSVVFVPADIPYATKTTEGDLYVIHFKILNYLYKDIEVLDLDTSPELKALFLSAIDEWNNKKYGYKHKAASIFYDILYLISNKNINNYAEKTELAQKCAEYISTHFGRSDFSIKEVADYFYISEAYLRKKFKEYFNISPKQYLLNQRIDFAKHLISAGYLTQEEISDKCGFASVKYFRTAFKHKTGSSIRQYKSR